MTSPRGQASLYQGFLQALLVAALSSSASRVAHSARFSLPQVHESGPASGQLVSGCVVTSACLLSQRLVSCSCTRSSTGKAQGRNGHRVVPPVPASPIRPTKLTGRQLTGLSPRALPTLPCWGGPHSHRWASPQPRPQRLLVESPGHVPASPGAAVPLRPAPRSCPPERGLRHCQPGVRAWDPACGWFGERAVRA